MHIPQTIFQSMVNGPKGPVTERYIERYKTIEPLEEVVRGRDDENFMKRTSTLLNYTIPMGGFFCIFDIILYKDWRPPNPSAVADGLQRIKYHAIPWIGGAIAYTATVHFVSGMRGGKSDKYNHFVGGLAVGSVIGKHNKNWFLGMISGLVFGGLGIIYKNVVDQGGRVMPDHWNYPSCHGNAFSHKQDFTTNYVTERPTYWARTEADVPRVFKQGQMGNGDCYTKWW